MHFAFPRSWVVRRRLISCVCVASHDDDAGGGAAAASPGRDADADARLQEQLRELSALRREKWMLVREFFDERRRAQQVEHDSLVGAINAVRGAARRGR